MNEITTREASDYIFQNKNTYLYKQTPEDFLTQISCIEDDKAQELIQKMFDSDNAKNTKEKGDSLEILVNYFLEESSMFERLKPDIRFNYCQVDHYGVFKPEIWSLIFYSHKDFRNETQAFLGESKRYGQKLDVTYVLKFECVKHIRGIKLGIYFTRKGITGQDYSDSNAVIKRLYDKDKQFSIVFKDDDWQVLKDNPKSFGYLFCKKIHDFLDTEKL